MAKCRLLLAFVVLLSFALPARAQDKLNFAYISPNAGSSSILCVAIFKNPGLDLNVIYIEGTPKALDGSRGFYPQRTSMG